MKKPVIKQLAIEQLSRGIYQPRVHFDKAALNELAASIKQQGLIEPIIVRPMSLDHYEIIAGERRWRAAQLAGLLTLPCVINEYSDEQAAAVTIIENVQRQDLTIIEEARAYKRLMDEFYFQHDDVAAMVGKSRSHISNLVRLLGLDQRVQKALEEKQVSLGHGRMLVGFSHGEQGVLLNKIIKNEWSVRKLEREIKLLKKKSLSPKNDRDVSRLESIIADSCGSPTEIEQGVGDGGWLKIRFFDNDTLAGILEKMGVDFQDEENLSS